MAAVFEQCGIEYPRDELVRCRDEYKDATEQQLEQCGTQTVETIRRNLEIKSGTGDPCDELEPYSADADQ